MSVLEEGAIAAAAARENLVPAALSKRVSAIEALLQTQLLVRTNKRVKPTPAGVALARRALSELDQIPLALTGYASGVCGLVRLFASTSALAQFLPGDIKSFLDKYPAVQIQVVTVSSATVTKALADNVADVGGFTSVPRHRGLDSLAYRQDRLILCVPKDHRLRMANVSFLEVLDEDFVAVPPGTSIGTLLARGASAKDHSLRVRMEVGSFDALCAMIGSGLGLGVLPETIVRRNASALGLKAIDLIRRLGTA